MHQRPKESSEGFPCTCRGNALPILENLEFGGYQCSKWGEKKSLILGYLKVYRLLAASVLVGTSCLQPIKSHEVVY